MAATDERTDQAPTERPRRRAGPVRAGLLAAVVFVLGLVAGAVTAVLVAAEPVVVADGTGGGTGGAGVPGGALPPEGVSAQFVVNGPCLGAVNAAQDTFLVVDDLGEAAAALDAAQLDEIVRRLIPLQERLETGLDACRVTTEVGAGGAAPSTVPPGEPLPTDSSPTGTPTTGSPATGTPTGGTEGGAAPTAGPTTTGAAD